MGYAEHHAKVHGKGKKTGKTTALKTVKNTSKVLKPWDEDSASELLQKVINFFCLFFYWKCYFTKLDYFIRYKFYQNDYKIIGIEVLKNVKSSFSF